MDKFQLVSEYEPMGDQPQAIKELVQGFREGNQCQTLLGGYGFRKDIYNGKCDSAVEQAYTGYCP